MENRLTAMEAELKDLKELTDKPETSSSWLNVVSRQPKESDPTVDDFISSLIDRVDSG